MTFVKWKITRTPFVGNQYVSTDTEEITRFHSIQVTKSLGDRKGSFSFKTTNFNDEYFGKFRPRDKITISRAINSSVVNDTTDLLMVGAVKDAQEDNVTATDSFNVQGYDFSASVMNAIIFSDPQGAELRIPEALESAVTSIRNDNPEFAVTWREENPSLNSDDGPFPLVQERWFYEPFTKILRKYSTNEYTEDGRYNWYVNTNNELVWIPESTNPDYTYNQLTDTDTKSIKIGKDTSAVVNFVIIKGGLDPKGSPITARYQDFSSSSRHGLKYKYYISDKGLSKTLNNEDMRQLGGSDSDGTLPGNISGVGYPITSTNTLMPWLQVIGETEVTSDSDYVSKFRRYIKQQLRKEGKEIVNQFRYGKLKIDIEVGAGTKNWGIGDLIEVSAYNVTLDGTFNTKKLRVEEIRYGELTDIYSLTEDKGTI